MHTCTFCGCLIVPMGLDAFGGTRWIRRTAYGDERVCSGRVIGPTEPHQNGYHKPLPFPDFASPTAVAEWLEV